MTKLANTILFLCGMAIAIQAVNGVTCYDDDGSTTCNGRDCYISRDSSTGQVLRGCGTPPGLPRGCSQGGSWTRCKCTTNYCNTNSLLDGISKCDLKNDVTQH